MVKVQMVLVLLAIILLVLVVVVAVVVKLLIDNIHLVQLEIKINHPLQYLVVVVLMILQKVRMVEMVQ